jgi:hypothetical protein
MLAATWMGDDLVDGESNLKPFRERVAPTLDLLGPASYTFLQASSDALVPHGRRSFSQTGFIADLTEEILDVLLALCEQFPTKHSVVELDPLGGAVSRVPEAATAAAGFRDAGWFYNAGATAPEPSADETCRRWVLATDAALTPLRLPGRYINYILQNDEATVREAYGDQKYARLQEIKARYDPNGVFTRDPERGHGAAAV